MQNETKHTPGPWKVADGSPRAVIAKEGWAVIDLGIDRDRGIPGMDRLRLDVADARLIAAAPELLEAHRETDEQIAETMSLVETGEMKRAEIVNLLVDLQNRSRAAIAKAEGRA